MNCLVTFQQPNDKIQLNYLVSLVFQYCFVNNPK